jgi:hypothetical protein
MIWDLVRRGDTVFEVPQRKYINNKEYLLVFTGDSKNKAKRIAEKQRIRHYHTRVIEISPTVWTVYRQQDKPEEDSNLRIQTANSNNKR